MKKEQVASISAIALLLSSTAILGCGGLDQPAVYPTAGKIIVNGVAPVGALLTLHPTSGPATELSNTRPYATVSDNGQFVLSTFGTEDGAPVGDYNITLYWPPDPDSDGPQSDRLLGRLSDAENSELQVTVREGANDLGLLELENVPVAPAEGRSTPGDRRGPPGS
jgi:hypothetical protein